MSLSSYPQPSLDESGLSPWSCYACRRRKVRCDRHNPCINCSKGGVECSFPVSGRMPTRRHDPSVVMGSKKKKQADLLGKLRRLEGLVEELGTQVERDPPTQANEGVTAAHDDVFGDSPTSNALQRNTASEIPSSNTVADNDGSRLASDPAPTDKSQDEDPDAQVSITQSFGKLIIGKDGSYYVGNRLWGVLASEVKKVREALEEEEQPSDDLVPDLPLDEGELAGANFRIPFSWNLGGFERKASQPLPSQVPFIWQVYQENVDPVVKILHVPTMSQVIKDCKGKFDALSPGMEALMFATSFSAATSMSESEVLDNFGETKADLLARWRFGTEQALSYAGLLNTTTLSVVQAFSIYLEAASHAYGNRATWIMTGLIVRTSVSRGLHRDGSRFSNVSLFDAEMRRRLFWHICLIDGQVGDCEVSQLAITENVFDTHQPSNYNDTDLVASMNIAPQPQEGFTDSTLFIIRCELWRLHRELQGWMNSKHSPASRDWSESKGEMLKVLENFKEKIKTKHVRHLTRDNHLHIFIHAITLLSLTNLELIINDIDIFREVHQSEVQGLRDHGPQSAFCPCRRPRSFLRALALLECLHLLRSEPTMQRWNWSVHGAMQWNAVRVILIQLYVRPWGPVCERAWAAVNRAFEDTADVRLNRSLWHPAFSLMAAVRKHRGAEIQRLRADPHMAFRLRSVASLHPSAVVLDSLQQLGDKVEFDTQAAEDRLTIETTLSTGGGCEMNPVSEDASGLPDANRADMMALDWIDVSPQQLGSSRSGAETASSGVTFLPDNMADFGDSIQGGQQHFVPDQLGSGLDFDLGIIDAAMAVAPGDDSWMQSLETGAGSQSVLQHGDGDQQLPSLQDIDLPTTGWYLHNHWTGWAT